MIVDFSDGYLGGIGKWKMDHVDYDYISYNIRHLYTNTFFPLPR